MDRSARAAALFRRMPVRVAVHRAIGHLDFETILTP